MANNPDYKKTLQLPKTDFPMKAGLAQKEPKTLAFWQEKQIYQKRLEQNQNNEPFILHDGPPYANGSIHFGHILNKTLKDFIVKYKNLNGFLAPYVPGWDCHGLPIEQGAVKKLGLSQRDYAAIDPITRRKACRDYAHDFIENQKQSFIRLGGWGDWQNPYLTLSNDYEAETAQEFARLYQKGFIYQGFKPVHWCPVYQTALAEAEIEFEDHVSPSIYVAFELVKPENLNLPQKHPVHVVIWTTTPWTLTANVALAFGEKFNYGIYQSGNAYFIFAKDLFESVSDQLVLDKPLEFVREISAKELIKLCPEATHPFMQRKSKLVLGHHVSLEAGTGVVHIAPGHGMDDYLVGLKNHLPLYSFVDEAARFIPSALKPDAKFDEVVDWEGQNVFEANQQIVSFLNTKGFLLSDPELKLKHSYPHCWRSKKPIIFRATKQWFLKIDHAELRKKTLAVINGKVRWIPHWGHDRIFGMIENRPDWCLSRQRIWGVPIIIHHCTECEKPLLTEESASFIIQKFRKDGADAWWQNDDALLPEGTTCECGSTSFTKDQSILDVWFDSGVSHRAVLDTTAGLGFPAHLYLEGSDQHRGWFHSSLLTSMATRGVPPYKEVLTHGFVVDGKGRKYSKSAKNYVAPEKIINQNGAEILRLWVASEDYRQDTRVSNEILKVLGEVYRKIRNTTRFMLGNFNDFNFNDHYVAVEDRTEMDRFFLARFTELIQKITKAYDAYEFHTVHHSLNKFFTLDLSAVYLDILKDRLYCDAQNSRRRRSAQSTMWDMLLDLVVLMAPILSFTAEEIFGHFPDYNQKPASVFLLNFPQPNLSLLDDNELYARWERVLAIRSEVLKALEAARNQKLIGHPLDARVVIAADAEAYQFLAQYQDEWEQIFIVSQVELLQNEATQNKEGASSLQSQSYQIEIQKAKGAKCDRCWNYKEELNQESQNLICGRCRQAVEVDE